jgi:hypothetical protein
MENKDVVNSINLIDPNRVNANINNSDDLTIYVDLIAESRGNTIFRTKTNSGNTDVYNETNLMGYKQNTKIFTTDYTEIYNQNGDNFVFEGFGIDSINIVTNSSYVPTVTIKFTDVKGQSFFNKGENSPYAVLTMFPPPIYILKIKGYYGSTLEYKLHLLNNSIAFNAETGNFDITSSFVGNTFAPLADILFRYVIEAPYIGEDQKTKVLDKTENLNSTLELISRSKTLNNQLSTFYDSNENIREFNIVKEKKERLGSVVKNNYVLPREIINIDLVRLVAIPKDISVPNRNYLEVFFFNMDFMIANDLFIIPVFENTTINIDNNPLLVFFRDKIVTTNFFNDFIKNKIPTNNELITYKGKNVSALNISKIFRILNSDFDLERKKLCDLSNTIQTTIDDITYKTLGFVPTIENVFKILCGDIDILFNKIIKVYNNSLDKIETLPTLKNKIIANNKSLNNSNNIIIYPFPDIIASDNTKTHPEATRDADLISLPETQFVNDFIASFINTKNRREQENVKNELDEFGSKKWIPNNVYDIQEISFNNPSPYINKFNPQAIMYELLNRYLVITEYTYNRTLINQPNTVNAGQNFIGGGTQNEKILLEFITKAEGINLIQSLNNPNLIRTFLNDLERISNDNGYNAYLEDYTFENKNPEIYFNWTNPKSIDIVENGATFGILTANDTVNNESVNKLIEKINDRKIFKKLGQDFNEEFKIIGEDEFGFTIDKNNLFYFHDGNDVNKTYFINDRFLSSIFDNTIGDAIVGVMNFASDIVYYINELPNSEFKHFFQLNMLFINSLKKLDIVKNFVGSINIPNFKLLQLSSFFIPEFNIYYNNIINIINNNDFNSRSKNDTLNAFNILKEYKETFSKVSLRDKDEFIEYYKNNYLDNLDCFNKMFETMKDDGKMFVDFKDYFDSNDFKFLVSDNLGVKKYLLINSINFINGEPVIPFDITSPKTYLINNRQEVLEFLRGVSKTVAKDLEAKADEKQKAFSILTSTNVDNNIKQEVYYSFKNIVDRWFTSSLRNENRITGNGYSIIENQDKPLIKYFTFVDRANNKINNNIIDVSILTEFENDFDVNILSVFSKLLGDNGYQFFPLQNFINYTGSNISQYEDIFKTKSSYDKIINDPRFTCMYIGNTSSYATSERASYFVDDGVDFNPDTLKIPNDIARAENFFAFKVSFGENVQSIFNGISMNTEEHQPTNESLKIMSQILDGNVNEATPLNISQNLFSVFEQRSYTCKVDMLGNAMIQPTQFFQLENVPLYRGGYIILNVEHNIDSNNHMKTSFSGVRISIHEKIFINNAVSRNVNNGYYTCDDDDFNPNASRGNSLYDTNSSNQTSGENLNTTKVKDGCIIINENTKISNNLTFEDAIRSPTASSNDFINCIPIETVYRNKRLNNQTEIIDGDGIFRNMKNTAKLFDRLQEIFKNRLTITSFYRNQRLNGILGSSNASDHLIGCAMDFVLNTNGTIPIQLNNGQLIYNNLDVYNYILNDNTIPYYQLINEYPVNGIPDWIHLSTFITPKDNKRESFIIN